MQLFRYALLAILLPFFTVTQANWSALNLGSTGSRSITTFNGAIYVATYNSGIRKSMDDGANWTLVNTGLPMNGSAVNVQSVGHNATTLFCGTESGIYRSLNEGASWELANGPLPANTTVYANKFYSFGGVTFAVFSGMVSQNAGGVFRTVDNGTTWLQGFSGLSANMTVQNLDDANGVLYAATSTALMKSSDLGQTWVPAGTAGSSNFAVYSVQAVGNRLVVLSALGCRFSTNDGNTWTNATNYPSGTPPAGAVPQLIAYDGKYFAITKLGNSGCYRSLDNGVTWSEFNTNLGAADVFSQEEFHASGNNLYIACLFDSYSTPGTTTDVSSVDVVDLPVPFPTAFTSHFTVDMSIMAPGGTLLLMDASGREVRRRTNVPAALVRIERGNLIAGRYHCLLLDPLTGTVLPLGAVIAE
jgi:hypothetical protein